MVGKATNQENWEHLEYWGDFSEHGIIRDLSENPAQHSGKIVMNKIFFRSTFKYLCKTIKKYYFGRNSLMHFWHGQSVGWVTYLVAFLWNDPWWWSLLQLLFVAISSEKVSLKMIGKGFVLCKINSSPSAFYIIKPTCISWLVFKVSNYFKQESPAVADKPARRGVM